jgi:hypothetical protein
MRTIHNRSPRDGERPPRRALSYANVVSTLALLLVLAGSTAYAANHYLITRTSQIRPSVLVHLRGRVGATGAAGATGPTGPSGASGVANYNLAQSATESNPTGDQDVAIANCPAGESALGGGGFGSAVGTGQSITTSEPASSGSGWLVAMSNTSGSNDTFVAYAVCAAVGG